MNRLKLRKQKKPDFDELCEMLADLKDFSDENPDFDMFTKMDFQYENAVASIKVANSVKSEGDLIISGSEGYAYVPAPWWKTDYFELRYENQEDNKKYF